MALHPDGTMDVEVDGVPSRRPYSVNHDYGYENVRLHSLMTRYEPQTFDNEKVMHTLDGRCLIFTGPQK